MSAPGPRIEEPDLLAYADGRLPEARRAEVEAFLAANPERALEVQSWQRQNEAMSALFAPVGAERIPERLNPRLIAFRLRRPAFGWPALAAAAVVVLALGLGGGWLLRDVVHPQEGASEALIDNAVAYSDPGKRVTLALESHDRVAALSVLDQGIGIDPKDAERVFERFYRADPARSRETGGTGLGLSIVKHVAARHGGTVDLWSQPAIGSTFTLKLPVHQEGP